VEVRAARRRRKIPHLIEELGDVVCILALRTSISGRVDARRASECIDDESRVVGDSW
jgi:hypothetical protein